MGAVSLEPVDSLSILSRFRQITAPAHVTPIQ